MWNAPTKEQLAKIAPALYATEGKKLHEKTMVAHFFIGACDWYICEYDPENDMAFGWACLGDPQMAEWGYIPIFELRKIKVQGAFEVDYDKYFTPTEAKNIDKIFPE